MAICFSIQKIYVIIQFSCFFNVQDIDAGSSERKVQLKPDQEVRGHPLGPACLTLSPHHLWLASVGRDGLLRVRETASMVDRLTYIFKTLQLYLSYICCP